MTENSQLELDLFIKDLPEKSRTGLLPVLLKAQELFGYIPESTARIISDELHVPLADIYGVIEFYSLFYSEPAAKNPDSKITAVRIESVF